MIGKKDCVKSKFAPLLSKSLKSALAHRIATQFPRIGGPRMTDLCAEMILEVLTEHVKPRESMHAGQVLWLAISVNDPPSRNKTTASTDLVPVVLDLSIDDDVEAILDRHPADHRLEAKCVRLCRQAFEQGGLLSNVDLAMILSISDSRVAHSLSEFETRTGTIVPRRATLHDVGTAVTHKRVICLKRYLEGKPSDQIARETFHSIDAVDRYLGTFDRVRHCRTQNMSPQETAFTLNCTLGLVHQYLQIDAEIRGDVHD